MLHRNWNVPVRAGTSSARAGTLAARYVSSLPALFVHIIDPIDPYPSRRSPNPSRQSVRLHLLRRKRRRRVTMSDCTHTQHTECYAYNDTDKHTFPQSTHTTHHYAHTIVIPLNNS